MSNKTSVDKDLIINNIYNILKTRGIKIGEFESDICNITKGYISRLKLNNSVPHTTFMFTVADKLNISLEELTNTFIPENYHQVFSINSQYFANTLIASLSAATEKNIVKWENSKTTSDNFLIDGAQLFTTDEKNYFSKIPTIDKDEYYRDNNPLITEKDNQVNVLLSNVFGKYYKLHDIYHLRLDGSSDSILLLVRLDSLSDYKDKSIDIDFYPNNHIEGYLPNESLELFFVNKDKNKKNIRTLAFLRNLNHSSSNEDYLRNYQGFETHADIRYLYQSVANQTAKQQIDADTIDILNSYKQIINQK